VFQIAQKPGEGVRDLRRCGRRRIRRILADPAAGLLVALALLLSGCGERSADPSLLPEQVLVIGVEAMSWERLDPLLSRGDLPHLQKLIRAGTRGVLRAPDPLEPALELRAVRPEHGSRGPPDFQSGPGHRVPLAVAHGHHEVK